MTEGGPDAQTGGRERQDREKAPEPLVPNQSSAATSAHVQGEPLPTAVDRDGGDERRRRGRFPTRSAQDRWSAHTTGNCCTIATASRSRAIGAPSPHSTARAQD